MAEYSIKDLENFTNIKAHTLRIWELRYNLLQPKRTDTNIRYYSDGDLKKILNINLLYSNGYKISKIAKLSDSEITAAAADILRVGASASTDHVERFIQLIIELDEKGIQQKLADLNQRLGTTGLYTEVMIPLLRKIGDLWQVDTITVSHEHFFSNILRDFLITETGKLKPPKKFKGRIVLFLHEREMHELSLLYYHHILKAKGYECFYLGQNVPMKDLQSMINQMKPDYVFTSIIAEADRVFFADFIRQLCSIIPPRRIYMGGYQLQRYLDLVPETVYQIQSEKDIDL